MSSSINNTTTVPPNHHLAAILPSKDSPLTLTHRQTPTPGAHELLINVQSIALNPIDCYQRDSGQFLTGYPAVIGSDISGTVISAGSEVSADAAKPGTRVAAAAPTFYMGGKPDYGAFQTRVLVPAANVVELPKGISFNEAATLPMAVATAWSGWYSIGLARDTKYTAADKKGMLVWGGASSIGTAAVQIASNMGFRVYVTASEKHHDYLKGLGASRCFDYKSEGVVEKIVKAAKEDGVSIQIGFDAVIGALQSCLDILKAFPQNGTVNAKLASAIPPNLESAPKVEGIEVKFIMGPADERERTEHHHFIFGVWLKEKLAKGEFVPSPKVKVVEGGLEGANKGLDELKGGVSGVKLVLEV